jgi:hypothetical protein
VGLSKSRSRDDPSETLPATVGIVERALEVQDKLWPCLNEKL